MLSLLIYMLSITTHEEHNMNWERTRRLLILHEGEVVSEPYQCSEGYWSFGIGRNLQANPPTLQELLVLLKDKQEGVHLMLANDLDKAEAEALKYPWYADLSEVRQAVIISAIFQLGAHGWAQFKRTHKALQYSSWHIAAQNMKESLWYRQTPARVEQLATMLETNSWPI